jgi:DNA-binding transcriptional MerR regulator
LNKNNEKILQDIINNSIKVDHIRPGDIPNIDLYMDQVTTFMDSFLNNSKRYDEDKILTKTMINNYTKNNLLPPPNKKKYSKEHILLLIFIYYYKNMLSITDIQNVLSPIIDTLFEHKDTSLSLQRLYSKIVALEVSQVDSMKADIEQKLATATGAFAEIDSPNKDLLTLFAFTSMLSHDIYIKKHLMETLIDEFFTKEFSKATPKQKADAKQKTTKVKQKPEVKLKTDIKQKPIK